MFGATRRNVGYLPPWKIFTVIGREIEILRRMDDNTQKTLIELWKDYRAEARHYANIRSSTSFGFLVTTVAISGFLINSGQPNVAFLSSITIGILAVWITSYFHNAHVWNWHISYLLMIVILDRAEGEKSSQNQITKAILEIKKIYESYYIKNLNGKSILFSDKEFFVENSFLFAHIIVIFISLWAIINKMM